MVIICRRLYHWVFVKPPSSSTARSPSILANSLSFRNYYRRMVSWLTFLSNFGVKPSLRAFHSSLTSSPSASGASIPIFFPNPRNEGLKIARPIRLMKWIRNCRLKWVKKRVSKKDYCLGLAVGWTSETNLGTKVKSGIGIPCNVSESLSY